MDLGFGSAGDLASIQTQAPGTINIPGEGIMQDEMVALQQHDPVVNRPPDAPQRSTQFLSSGLQNSQGASAKRLAALAKAQTLTGRTNVDAMSTLSVAAAARNSDKVVEEFDSTEEDEEEADDYRTVKGEESKTAEDISRQARGDVEKAKPTLRRKPRIVVRRKVKLNAAVQQQATVAAHSAVAQEQAPGNDKMMAQCMTFAGWVKGQGSTGPDLVRIWKGTCMPSVTAGTAPPNYVNMCNALGTAVSKFAVRPWAPADLCQAVMAVFHESGVGATPL